MYKAPKCLQGPQDYMKPKIAKEPPRTALWLLLTDVENFTGEGMKWNVRKQSNVLPQNKRTLKAIESYARHAQWIQRLMNVDDTVMAQIATKLQLSRQLSWRPGTLLFPPDLEFLVADV